MLVEPAPAASVAEGVEPALAPLFEDDEEPEAVPLVVVVVVEPPAALPEAGVVDADPVPAGALPVGAGWSDWYSARRSVKSWLAAARFATGIPARSLARW